MLNRETKNILTQKLLLFMIVYIFKMHSYWIVLSLKLLKFSKSRKMGEPAWCTCLDLKLFAHKILGQSKIRILYVDRYFVWNKIIPIPVCRNDFFIRSCTCNKGEINHRSSTTKFCNCACAWMLNFMTWTICFYESWWCHIILRFA